MLTYSLGFLKVQGAAYHSIKNYRAVVHKSQNFNRERRFVGHSSNMCGFRSMPPSIPR